MILASSFFCTLIFNWFGCNLFYFLLFVRWFISFFFFSARHEICVYYDKGFLSLFSSHFFLLFFIFFRFVFFSLLKKHGQTRAARNDISREREEGDSGEVDRLLNKNVQSVPFRGI